jgi:2-polyprenyl-3-methyl-5-hydroxy-6-metoxy-1,4-benzoquinol methylase
MKIDLQNNTVQQVLQKLSNISLDPNEILQIVINQKDLDNITYKSWIDFAQIFYLKMLTPNIEEEKIILKFEKLNTNLSFHTNKTDSNEKYGTQSEFFNIDKTNYFSFVHYYTKALEFINIKSKQKILNLGINKGDEFSIIQNMLNKDELKNKEFIGIDYSNSIIEYAKKSFNNKNFNFICHDINKLDQLNLTKFDLIVSIGTLQSSNIDFKVVFMNLIQNYLAQDGSIILGFPNCRWIDQEMIYGAKAPNYNFPEMSLVIKDIYFCKKYLQQKKYRVTITGKDYIFLTARKIK